jgi:hypothetical protein
MLHGEVDSLASVFVERLQVIEYLLRFFTESLLTLLLLLKPHEKLLGVTPDLGACSRANMLFNQSPVFVVPPQAFEEASVLCLRPSAMLRNFVCLRESILREKATFLLLKGRLTSQVWLRHSTRLSDHGFLSWQDEGLLRLERDRIDQGDAVSVHIADLQFIIESLFLFVRRKV